MVLYYIMYYFTMNVHIICGIVKYIIHRWIIELGSKVLADKIYIFSYWN